MSLLIIKILTFYSSSNDQTKEFEIQSLAVLRAQKICRHYLEVVQTLSNKVSRLHISLRALEIEFSENSCRQQNSTTAIYA